MNNYNNEDKENRNIVVDQAKEIAKKQVKKGAKKLLKKGGKIALKAAKKAALGAIKALVSFLSGISLPFIAIALLVIGAIIIIYLATTLIFSMGDEEFLGDAYELKAYIEEKVHSSIDYSKKEQREYMLPVNLVLAIMQIYESEERKASSKDAIDVIVNALVPQFDYEDVEAYTESYTTTCDSTGCTNSSISKQTYRYQLLKEVIAWNGTATYSNEGKLGPWVSMPSTSTTVTTTDKDGNKTSETITTTRYSRAYQIESSKNWEENYSYFESILMAKPFNYKKDDLIMVESLYQLTGGEMNYSTIGSNGSMVGDGYWDGDINVIPGAGVPAEYMQYYLAAQAKFKVDWYFLAAFHWVETKFSTHKPMISSVGAEGHLQFMGCTWVGWGHPGCSGNGYLNASTADKENPALIKKYGGYGIDADGDGKASMWSLPDSIMGAANLLSSNGFSTNRDKAIRKYNHSDSYVALINKKAQEFKNAAKYTDSGTGGKVEPNELGFVAPTRGRITSSWGNRELAGSPDFHAALDIANSIGTKIVAIGDGVVTQTHTGCPVGYVGSKCGYGWGNYVRITHVIKGVTYESIYGHMSAVNVAINSRVKAGQIIGVMGSSGSSTGPHLHLELHQPKRYGNNNNALNPLYYVPAIPK